MLWMFLRIYCVDIALLVLIGEKINDIIIIVYK